ncbi:flavin reductase family protein [Kiloniella sp. b19]|uniref:flavin reductase family protein n=1 Tax=Kiloniella sp. GXU_MW_B19 TaxID=3141326 RepID=UPI0031DB058C
MAFDKRDFRSALGAFATGVTVVTTRSEDGTLNGLTANSFSSVSLEPPLILFCIDKSANAYKAFMKNENFAINILSEEQQAISNAFAFEEDRWSKVQTRTMETGAPVIDGSLASFDCEVFKRVEAGDHVIMIGEVKSYEKAEAGSPLLYAKGGYASLAS